MTRAMDFVSALYFSSWSVYEPKHFVLDLPADQLTHVFYAFMKIDTNTGTVSVSDQWADVDMPMPDGCIGSLASLQALKRKSPWLRSVMSIGGWGTHEAFFQVTSNPQKLNQFVTSSVELVSRWGFDGIDIDWEYPADDMQAMQLVELLRALRRSLHPAMVLTVAAPASFEKISVLRVKEMDLCLSFWNVMCYDFSGEWSDHTGHHSNLYPNGRDGLSADSALKEYMARGVPASKLVLGMPMYGRKFHKPSFLGPGAKFAKTSGDIVDYCNLHGTPTYDDVSVGAFTYDEKKKDLIFYDSVQCAQKKAHYVRSKGLRGGFWWDSKGDSKTCLLLTAFLDELRQ